MLFTCMLGTLAIGCLKLGIDASSDIAEPCERCIDVQSRGGAGKPSRQRACHAPQLVGVQAAGGDDSKACAHNNPAGEGELGIRDGFSFQSVALRMW